MTRQVTIACAFVLIVLGLSAAQAQQSYPAFTMVTQRTDYDAKGEALSTQEWTSYHSASGDWRSVGYTGGYEMASIYRRGRGVYSSNSRTGVLLKDSDHAPGCPLRTAEQLRGDPKFTRTEMVLGFKAYVLSERTPVGYTMDTFFVPELGGGTPVKRILVFDNGRKIVDEPTTIKLGEPAAGDIAGSDYRFIGQPIFNQELDSKIISKPDPVYPPAALTRRISGWVSVSIIVDEGGRVISAASNTPIPFLTDAAVEAAYQAWFSPTTRDNMPVLAAGNISYQFRLPQVPQH